MLALQSFELSFALDGVKLNFFFTFHSCSKIQCCSENFPTTGAVVNTNCRAELTCISERKNCYIFVFGLSWENIQVAFIKQIHSRIFSSCKIHVYISFSSNLARSNEHRPHYLQRKFIEFRSTTKALTVPTKIWEATNPRHRSLLHFAQSEVSILAARFHEAQRMNASTSKL